MKFTLAGKELKDQNFIVSVTADIPAFRGKRKNTLNAAKVQAVDGYSVLLAIVKNKMNFSY